MVRTDATDRMPIFGERHLRAVLTEYARYDNRGRPHRARHLHPPQPDPVADISTERIKRRSVIGGLINGYEPAT
jgi:putative transposase